MRAVVLCAAVAAACLVSAGGVSAHASAKIVIRVLSVTTSYREHAHPPAGRAGDTATGTDRLLNAVAQFGRPKNAVVGSDSATMTFLASNGLRLCGVARFPDGTVRICGRARLVQGGYSVPVVGGTKAYAGASGTVYVAGSADQALNVFELTIGPTA